MYDGSVDFKGDRVLAATVYHFIKDNPLHWNQRKWVCGTGMCYAGWYAHIHDMNVEIVVSPVNELSCFVGDDIIGNYVARLMGFDPENCEDDRIFWNNDLFNASNTLDDIRRILTVLLGEDPEDIEPDLELLSFGKKVELMKFGNE